MPVGFFGCGMKRPGVIGWRSLFSNRTVCAGVSSRNPARYAGIPSGIYPDTEKPPSSQTEVFLPSGTLDLTGAKATGANVNGRVSTVDHSLDSADVRFPCSVGFAVGVGHVMTEHNALAANTAISHFDTS